MRSANAPAAHICVLEFVEGGSLADKIKGIPQPVAESADLVATLARAIHYAHEQGIIHRDLKPANVLLCAPPESATRRHDRSPAPWSSARFATLPKISDFGLARLIDDQAIHSIGNAIMGTPSYMAPEQADSGLHDAGASTDIYSLGAILYEMLTGRPPFIGETTFDTVLQARHEEPIAPRRIRPQLPLDLQTICLKCLRKEPAKRYSSAEDLADDLERFLVGRPILARPVGRVERCWRWCRRNPIVASLVIALAFVVGFGFVGVSWKWLESDARRRRAMELAEAKDSALQREKIERREKEVALATARINLYFHSIALAHREWQANNLAIAEKILDECPQDLRNWEWHYLKRLCHDETAVFRGCGDSVQAIAFSPDGQRLATAAADGTVVIWEVRTHRRIHTILGKTGNFSLLRFNRDGNRLVRVSKRVMPGVPFASDTNLTSWDTQTGRPIFDIPNPFVGYKLALNDDATRLTVVTTGGTTRLWDIQTGTELAKLPFRLAGVCVPAISPDGKLIAGVNANGRLLLWSAADGSVVRELERPAQRIVGVDFSPDSRRLADARDQSICIWDVGTGQKLREMTGTNRGIHSAQFTADGDRLLVRAGRRDVEIQPLNPGGEAAYVRTNTSIVTAAALKPDGTAVAIGCPDGSVRLWDAGCLGGVRTLARLPNQLHVCLSSNGMKLAAMNRKVIVMRDSAAGQSLGTSKPEPAGYPVALSDDGGRIACADASDGYAILDAKSGQGIAKLVSRGRRRPRLSAVTGNSILPRFAGRTAGFSRDGNLLATGSDGRTISIWNIATGDELCSIDSPWVRGVAPAFSPDGRRLAIAGTTGDIRIFDSHSGELFRQIAAHVGYSRALDFDPAGEPPCVRRQRFIGEGLGSSHRPRVVLSRRPHRPYYGCRLQFRRDKARFGELRQVGQDMGRVIAPRAADVDWIYLCANRHTVFG